MKTWQYALFLLGVTLCLTDAFLMFDGSILGENTTGIATVIGIIGIGIISTFSSTIGLGKARKNSTKH
jgi:hypothetical protein